MQGPRHAARFPMRSWVAGLDGVLAALAGADADHLLDAGDEDLAVADASGARGGDDRLHRAFDDSVFADHLDLHLGEKVHHVFGAAVQFGVALLPPESLGLHHGDALQADLVQRFLHLIQLERLDDRLDLFHPPSAPGCTGPPIDWLPRLACWLNGSGTGLHAACHAAMRWGDGWRRQGRLLDG